MGRPGVNKRVVENCGNRVPSPDCLRGVFDERQASWRGDLLAKRPLGLGAGPNPELAFNGVGAATDIKTPGVRCRGAFGLLVVIQPLPHEAFRCFWGEPRAGRGTKGWFLAGRPAGAGQGYPVLLFGAEVPKKKKNSLTNLVTRRVSAGPFGARSKFCP